MRVTGWSKLFLDFVNGRPPRHVVTERELFEIVALAGRALGDDWRTVICHAMRAIGFRLRQRDRVYVRRMPRIGNGGAL